MKKTSFLINCFIKLILLYFIFHSPSFATSSSNSCINNIGDHYHARCYPGGECELPYLDFYKCGLKDQDVPYILEFIQSKHSDLVKIFLEYNHITSVGVKTLLKHKDFININLNSNEVDDEGAIALGSLTNLYILELNNNHIGNKGLSGLLHNPILVELSIANNSFDIEGIKSLENNPSITTLDISNNHIGLREARIIVTMPQLEVLIANNNNLGDEGVSLFANIYRDYLNLSFNNNNIGDEGIIALSHNQSPKINLSLNQNKIGSRGLQALAQNDSLLSLSLADNQINDKALRFLVNNRNLNTLDLSGNKIGLEGAKILSTMYRMNDPFTLIANNNLFGDDGVIVLAKSWNFRELSIRQNNLHNISAFALVDSVPLRFIDIRNNHLGKEGIQRLHDSDKTVLTDGIPH